MTLLGHASLVTIPYIIMLDIIIAVVIAIGVTEGLTKGFISELASSLGLVAGLLVARALFGQVAERLAPALDMNVTLAQILAFIMIWMAVPIALSIVASVLSRALDVVHLGCLNRWLGCGMGALKYLAIVGVLIHVLEYIDPKSEMLSKASKEESVLYGPIKDMTGHFFPVFKNMTYELMEM